MTKDLKENVVSKTVKKLVLQIVFVLSGPRDAICSDYVRWRHLRGADNIWRHLQVLHGGVRPNGQLRCLNRLVQSTACDRCWAKGV